MSMHRTLLIPRPAAARVGARVAVERGGAEISSSYYGSHGHAVLYVPAHYAGSLATVRYDHRAVVEVELPDSDSILWGEHVEQLPEDLREWLRIREMGPEERLRHELVTLLTPHAHDIGTGLGVAPLGDMSLKKLLRHARRLGVTVPAMLTITLGDATTDPAASEKWAVHPRPPTISADGISYAEGYGVDPADRLITSRVIIDTLNLMGVSVVELTPTDQTLAGSDGQGLQYLFTHGPSAETQDEPSVLFAMPNAPARLEDLVPSSGQGITGTAVDQTARDDAQDALDRTQHSPQNINPITHIAIEALSANKFHLRASRDDVASDSAVAAWHQIVANLVTSGYVIDAVAAEAVERAAAIAVEAAARGDADAALMALIDAIQTGGQTVYLGAYNALTANERNAVDLGEYVLHNNQYWQVDSRNLARANAPGSGPNDGWRRDAPLERHLGNAAIFCQESDWATVAGTLYVCRADGMYTAADVTDAANWTAGGAAVADASSFVEPGVNGQLPPASDHEDELALAGNHWYRSVGAQGHDKIIGWADYGPTRPGAGAQELLYGGSFADPPHNTIGNYVVNTVLWDRGSEVWIIKPAADSTRWSSYSGPLGWHSGHLYLTDDDAAVHVANATEIGDIYVTGHGAAQKPRIVITFTPPTAPSWAWIPIGLTIQQVTDIANARAAARFTAAEKVKLDETITGSAVDARIGNHNLSDTAHADIRALVAASGGSLSVEAYAADGDYARGSFVTHGGRFLAYTSSVARSANHDPGEHPGYWVELDRTATKLNVAAGSHRFADGTLIVDTSDDKVYLAATDINEPRDLVYIRAQSKILGGDFIDLTRDVSGIQFRAHVIGTAYRAGDIVTAGNGSNLRIWQALSDTSTDPAWTNANLWRQLGGLDSVIYRGNYSIAGTRYEHGHIVKVGDLLYLRTESGYVSEANDGELPGTDGSGWTAMGGGSGGGGNGALPAVTFSGTIASLDEALETEILTAVQAATLVRGFYLHGYGNESQKRRSFFGYAEPGWITGAPDDGYEIAMGQNRDIALGTGNVNVWTLHPSHTMTDFNWFIRQVPA